MIPKSNHLLSWKFVENVQIISTDWQWSLSESFDGFDSDGRYYCYTSDDLKYHHAFLTAKDTACGQYIWMEFETKSSPHFFGILIDLHWLQEQLQIVASSPMLHRVISQVLDRWDRQPNVLISRHLVYQKHFQVHSYHKLLTTAYFYELLNRFVVEVELETGANPPNTFRSSEINVIRGVVDQVLQTLHHSTPSIEQMAISAGMSASKFKILFKEIYGLGPHQYILDKKLAYAHTLFKTGQYTLTQIAYKIGYSHTSGFTRIYKKYYENPS